jgi:steroid delta-isomerase-like uncharacterized protein
MVSAWNRHDVAAVAACYAPDVTIVTAGEGAPAQGIEALTETLGALFDGFPDLRHETRTTVIEGNCIAIEWLLLGTHTGLLPSPAGFLPPTGNRIEIPGVSFIWLNDEGKAAREHSYTDPTTMARQLGLYHDHDGRAQEHDHDADGPDSGYDG